MDNYIIKFLSGICICILIFSCKKKIIENDKPPFYDERNISRTEGSSILGRRYAIDKFGNVHIVWCESVPGGNWKILYKIKFVSGVWSDTENVPIAYGEPDVPSVAIDSYGNPHVVWREVMDRKTSIYYSYKENNRWKTPQKISRGDEFADLPDIGIDGQDRVHVVYMGQFPGVRYTRKEKGNWILPITLPGCGHLNPSLYVEESGKLHVVFQGADDIWYVYSPDGGNTWEEAINISNSPSYYSWSSDVVVDEFGKVYVCWIEAQFGVGPIGIFISEKDLDGGWSTPAKINSVRGNPFAPRIRNVYRGNIYISYMDGIDLGGGILKDDIFLVKGSNGRWTKPFNISNTSANSISGARGFKISSEKLYIAWTEAISRGKEEIYYDEIFIK